jgi:hypothetical protein
MKPLLQVRSLLLAGAIGLSLPAFASDADARFNLRNGEIEAVFGDHGLARLTRPQSEQSLHLAGDSSALTINGVKLTVPGLRLLDSTREKDKVTYTYATGEQRLEVIYELKPGWGFFSKQFMLMLPTNSTSRAESIEMLRVEVKTPLARECKAGSSSGAVFLRLGEPNPPPKFGAFLALQNPFLNWERKGAQIAMAYAPDMEWRARYGPFASDRVCIGIHALTGSELPARALAEWKYVREPERAFEGKPMLDSAEFDAVRRCVDALALFRPKKSLRVHVPWCENDYQIDVATPAGRTEWKRILDQCAAVEVENPLFTRANSAVAPLKDNADAWGWENCLWLGLDGVRVYHDQALLKEAGGGITPRHQDQHYWPLATDSTITMWLPLANGTPDMGTMHFASGSHRDGYLGDMPISDASEAKFEPFIRERVYAIVRGAAMAAGDATFHYGWTLHGAPGNSSDRTREVMTIIWFADGTRVCPLDNANRQRDRDRWLPGLRPGDLAASELNPLVFKAPFSPCA